MPSLFVQVTFVPALTVIEAGEKAKLARVTEESEAACVGGAIVGVETGVDAEPAGDAVVEHAARVISVDILSIMNKYLPSPGKTFVISILLKIVFESSALITFNCKKTYFVLNG